MKDNTEALIEAYKKLGTTRKCEEIISSLKELIAIFEYISKSQGYDNQAILNKEVQAINKKDVTIDEYLTAIYAYITCFENLSGSLLSQIIKTS